MQDTTINIHLIIHVVMAFKAFVTSEKYVTENTTADYQIFHATNITRNIVKGNQVVVETWTHTTKHFISPNNISETNSMASGKTSFIFPSPISGNSSANNKENSSNNNLFNVNNILRMFWIFLALIGLILNSLSFLIIVQQGLIKVGFWCYMASLGVIDNMAIIMSFFSDFHLPPYSFLSSIVNLNEITCDVLFGFQYYWQMTSFYTVCLITAERAILILFPFKTPPRPKRVVVNVILLALLTFVVMSSYIYNLFGITEARLTNVSNNSTESVRYCTILPKYHAHLHIIFVFELVTYALLPILIILTSNSLIVFALIRRARNPTLPGITANTYKDKYITYTLLAVSSYFVCSITPMVIFMYTWHYFYDTTAEATSSNSLYYTIVWILPLTNHCFNFVFYIMNGKNFREKTRLFFKSISCDTKIVDNTQNMSQITQIIG